MKTSFYSATVWVVSLLLSLVSAQAKADTTSTQYVESTIQSVIVYPDSARVTRHLKARIPAGESTLLLHYLPTEIDTTNIKTEIVKASDQAVVRDLSFLHDAAKVEKHPEMMRLKGELDTTQAGIKDIQKQIGLLKARLAYAEALTESFTSGFGSRDGELPTADTMDSIWQFYEKTHWEVDAKVFELETALKPLQEELKEQSEAYAELFETLKRSSMSLGILVESPSEAEIEMKLSYVVRNCSWEPVYEIRAYPEEETVLMRYQVNVFQNSGELWKDVELTLSSARANTSTRIPELYPISLNKIEPVLMRKAVGMKMEQEMDSMMVQAAPVAMEMAVPSFETNFSSYQVTLPQRFSMKSGNDPKKSLIAEVNVKGSFWTVVAAKSDLQAFLAVEVENAFEMPLLSGESILFVDDQMVGRSYVSNTPVGDTIELSLGVNENVSVERKPGKQNQADRGIFGKRTRISRQYFTVVENHSAREQRIVVKDQFPVSQNEKIEVNAIAPTKDQVKLDSNTGLFSWDFKLAAKASRELETRFEVSFPEDWDIPQNF